MMDKLTEAKRIKRNYSRRLERLRIRSTYHNDKEASIKIIKVMTEYNIKIKELGYRLTDEDEGRPNQLVLITKEWVELQKSKQTEIDKLLKKARKGDIDSITKIILELAK